MGKLNSPYGVKGWIRVDVYTEYLDSLLDFSEWWVQKPKTSEWQLLSMVEGKAYQKGMVVKFSGIDNPEDARLWGRASVAISRAEWPETDEEEDLYWID